MRDHGPILVALDGSELAEGALPYAAALARALGERLVLFTAWEGTESALGANFPSLALEVEGKATAYFGEYLEGIRARLGGGQAVATEVARGDAADEVPRAAERLGARVIVIATHGRSGIGRWLYGSTAARLLRSSATPLLAVGPHALQRPADQVSLGHILVPLDGSELSEAALPVAQSLAAALHGRVTLARVVGWAVQTYPYAMPDAYIPQVDEELETGAMAYLRQQEARVTGVPVDAAVVRGGTSDGLFDIIDERGIELVVMTTHARTGIARAALGSTADRALQAPVPVLLIRPD